jgi:uncharacterized protein (TIGR01777 family)
MRALVTGATGFIGKKLIARLERPVVLSRDGARAKKELGDVEAHSWNPEAGPPPKEVWEGVDVVFNLAGEQVSGRWSEKKKRAIRDSRILGTSNLVAGLAAASVKPRPRLLVSASAVGYYGDRGDELLDESATPADDFLAKVCVAWEAEAQRAKVLGVRVVMPRIGIVLGAGGGPLAQMIKPFKMGIGGRLGSGRQWVPWVHVEDVVGMMLFAVEKEALDGPMNAVGPKPVTNQEMAKALGHALSRPSFMPTPAFALKLALGEFSSAVLGSQRMVPKVAEAAGYRFRFPTIEAALADALGKGPASDEKAAAGQ